MNSFCKGKFKLFSRTLYIAPGISHHPFSKLLGQHKRKEKNPHIFSPVSTFLSFYSFSTKKLGQMTSADCTYPWEQTQGISSRLCHSKPSKHLPEPQTPAWNAGSKSKSFLFLTHWWSCWDSLGHWGLYCTLWTFSQVPWSLDIMKILPGNLHW